MARYIDAEKIVYHEHTECAGHGEYYAVRSVTDDKINEIPTADVVEVRHGYWKKFWECIDCRFDIYECSVCGNKAMGESNFCPNCGAEMGGKETE